MPKQLVLLLLPVSVDLRMLVFGDSPAFTPYTATFSKVVIYKGPRGDIEQRFLELHARNGDGALYKKTDEVDPQSGNVKRSLIQLTIDRVTYVVEPEGKKLFLFDAVPVDPEKAELIRSERSRNQSLKETTLLGRKCRILPMRSGKGTVSGEMWVDQAANFLLLLHYERHLPDGGVMTKHLEAQQILTDVAPNPAFFEIPNLEQYAVTDNRRK